MGAELEIMNKFGFSHLCVRLSSLRIVFYIKGFQARSFEPIKGNHHLLREGR